MIELDDAFWDGFYRQATEAHERVAVKERQRVRNQVEATLMRDQRRLEKEAANVEMRRRMRSGEAYLGDIERLSALDDASLTREVNWGFGGVGVVCWGKLRRQAIAVALYERIDGLSLTGSVRRDFYETLRKYAATGDRNAAALGFMRKRIRRP